MLIIEEKQSAHAKATTATAKEGPAEKSRPQQTPAPEADPKAVKKEATPSEAANFGGPVYSVQLGAFRSVAEARACKKKYSEKGLKITIITAANDKKEKIYKVRAGEFSDRKKAEALSLRLNKTGKLKTYITSTDG